MLLVFSGRTQWRMSTLHLTTFISGLPLCVAPVVGAPFVFQSHLQIPQSHFCAIPATCFVKDAAHVMLDYFLVCVGLCCDLCIRASLENQRCDSPLLTAQICISKQQRHDFPLHFETAILPLVHRLRNLAEAGQAHSRFLGG